MFLLCILCIAEWHDREFQYAFLHLPSVLLVCLHEKTILNAKKKTEQTNKWKITVHICLTQITTGTEQLNVDIKRIYINNLIIFIFIHCK